MDYKSRHPGALVWPPATFENRLRPEPYDQLYNGMLSELSSDDDQTTFLIHVASFDEENSMIHLIAIEAPRSCPKRQAFEWGEISWLDFWSHRGWLIQFEHPFGVCGPAHGRYITAADLDDRTIKLWQELGHKGPYHLKLEQLELGCEYATPGSAKAQKAERTYREFMIRHGHRFEKRAA